jgi:N utilization substance protein B
MLTRRHIRVKVMQSFYAFTQSKNQNLGAEKKFIYKSMEDMYDLFLLNLDLLLQVRNKSQDFIEKSQKKFLPTAKDINPSLNFVDNKLLKQLEQSGQLEELIEDHKLNNWHQDDEYVAIIWDLIKEDERFIAYLDQEATTYKEDKKIVTYLFKEIIAPNDKLYEYLEDKKLTWLDDLPLVNTAVLKLISKTKETQEQVRIPTLFKNEEDEEFAIDLLEKCLLNQEYYSNLIQDKTPNWDKDRIADIDSILLKMALCEFLKFPSIPVKVSINEYLEIAKEYSTPKSSIFINGILDKLSKELKEKGELNKVGRGLM